MSEHNKINPLCEICKKEVIPTKGFSMRKFWFCRKKCLKQYQNEVILKEASAISNISLNWNYSGGGGSGVC